MNRLLSRPWALFARHLCAPLAAVAALVLAPPVVAQDWFYSVRPGDTFWTISERLMDGRQPWQALADHNGLAPDALRAGQRIRIPVSWLEVRPVAARVARLEGRGTLVAAGDRGSIPLELDTPVETGSRVEVENGGYAIVEFADETRLFISGGSSITFDAVGSYGDAGMVDTSMRLHGGRVSATVRRQRGPASSFRVYTPAATAAVRGTDFRVAHDAGNGVSRAEVEEGLVGIRGGGESIRLAGGFGVVARVNAPLPPPVRLLPEPAIAPAGALQTSTTLAFEWTPQPGAVRYRAQLFDRSSPPATVAEALLDDSAWLVAAPPDGRYRFAVRGIDESELEGLTAELDVEIDARPLAPPPVAPLADAATHSRPPELRWGRPEGTVAARLQVARDPAFAELLFDARQPDGVSTLRPDIELEPGEYWWRLSGFSADGEEGPHSDARRFEMLVVPAAAEAGEAEVRDGRVALSWPPVPQAERYRFELSRNAGFDDVVRSEVVDGRSLQIDDLDGGTFHYRVRGISVHGVEGPVSPATAFDVPYPPLPPWLLMLLAPFVLVL